MHLRLAASGCLARAATLRTTTLVPPPPVILYTATPVLPPSSWQDTVAEMAKDIKAKRTGAAAASAEELYNFMDKVGHATPHATAPQPAPRRSPRHTAPHPRQH